MIASGRGGRNGGAGAAPAAALEPGSRGPQGPSNPVPLLEIPWNLPDPSDGTLNGVGREAPEDAAEIRTQDAAVAVGAMEVEHRTEGSAPRLGNGEDPCAELEASPGVSGRRCAQLNEDSLEDAWLWR